MYPYYIELIKTYGWDDYDAIYTNYFNKLVEERKAIFNDDYMSDEVMFTAFESNVATFGNAVTGTKLTLARRQQNRYPRGVHRTLSNGIRQGLQNHNQSNGRKRH